jgi:S-adenosylmethionine:tRNA ribosyltransferase-isomerase
LISGEYIVKTSDFDYHLPQELIAQTPVEPRDQSRLMVFNRSDGSLEHRRFFEVTDYLQDGDVLVFNNSRVIPARLHGKRLDNGNALEVLLLCQVSPNVWETLVGCDTRVDIGTQIEITGEPTNDGRPNRRVLAEVIELRQGGKRVIKFSDETLLLGKIPLPPYIHVPLSDPQRYQTVYADIDGSVAAPTAGLHFTPELMDRIKSRGIDCLFVTLHVGLDTFRPIRVADIDKHPIHQEYGAMSQPVGDRLSQAKREGRRIIGVGTTVVRLVEAVARRSQPLRLRPFEGWVDLFILPGYQFQVVDAIITNFHIPRSTLLMLVTAFAGRDLINKAYREAINRKYRFYSFGDAMMIL